MFRLEQRVSVKSTLQDLEWPDMKRDPAGICCFYPYLHLF